MIFPLLSIAKPGTKMKTGTTSCPVVSQLHQWISVNPRDGCLADPLASRAWGDFSSAVTCKWHSFIAIPGMNKTLSPETIERLRAELQDLDRFLVEIDGVKLKPSQCYRFDVDPMHVLFNTNCPEGLRNKIESILFKYAQ
jgi:hypothetical protein